jgi:hypothetical protein
MTLNEIAYNIKNIVNGGVSSDDSDISLRQIKYMINYYRANLLLQYTKTGRKVSDVCFQTDTYKVSHNGAQVKQVIGFNDNRAIRSILYKDEASIDSSFVNTPLVQHNDREFIASSRFMRNTVKKYSTLIDGRVYIWEGDSLVSDGVVEIKALLFNPTLADSYESDDTTPYPIPTELISVLTESILSKEMNVLNSIPKKLPNNQVDESRQAKQSK